MSAVPGGMRTTALALALLSGCGDGDSGREAQREARDADERRDDGVGDAVRDEDLDAAQGTAEDNTPVPGAPQVDASGAFADWLADSGIPFSAWLGDAGSTQASAPHVAPLDPDVTRALIGRAYAETSYDLQEPRALTAALSVATKLTGDTRLFVSAIQAGDAGVEVLYGAADLIDGGLAWQKPPARPRRFALGAGADGGVVSAPFTYVLEARIATTRVYRLYLEVERSIWSASFTPDRESLTAELRGAVTRAQLEHRPLDVLSCTAACGQNSGGFCNTDRALTLAAVLDCTDSAPDVDLDGDGENDAYRLRVALRANQVAAPHE